MLIRLLVRPGRSQPPPCPVRSSCGGVLVGALRRLVRLGPSRGQHRHRPAVQGQPALAAARGRDEPGFSAVPRPAGCRRGCPHPRGSRRDRGRTGATVVRRQGAFPHRSPAGCQPVPGERRPAVPASEAAFVADGPDDRRPAVPRPAGRRPVRPRPVRRAVAAGHGRDAGRRRPDALPDADQGLPPGDGRCARGPSEAAVLGDPAGRRRQRTGGTLSLRAGAAAAELRRAGAGRGGDRRRCAPSSPTCRS